MPPPAVAVHPASRSSDSAPSLRRASLEANVVWLPAHLPTPISLFALCSVHSLARPTARGGLSKVEEKRSVEFQHQTTRVGWSRYLVVTENVCWGWRGILRCSVGPPAASEHEWRTKMHRLEGGRGAKRVLYRCRMGRRWSMVKLVVDCSEATERRELQEEEPHG